jgi:geranylgeranyl diphosphate synthase type I
MKYDTKNLEGLPPLLANFYNEHKNFIKDAISTHYETKLSSDTFDEVTGIPSIFSQDLTSIEDTIFTPTLQYLTRGGKMLRPTLVALILQAYGKDSKSAPGLLAAIEVMEDSSIIMDDYIDNSELRRGGPCAHIIHGFPLANISSNTFFAYAHSIFYNNTLELDEATQGQLLDAVTEEWLQMAYGQIEELYWTEDNINDVTISQYFQETIARCAFLTFRGPMKYAGIIAGAPPKDIIRLGKIGEYLLIGYHIKGDNLDLQPDSSAWGKVAGEDITIGRRTLLINELLAAANEDDRALAESIISERTEDEAKKRKIYELIIKYNILKKAENLAEEYNIVAKDEISKLSMDIEARELLCEFADYCALTRSI